MPWNWNSRGRKRPDTFIKAATPNQVERTTFYRGVRITVAGSCEADCDRRIKHIIETYKAEFPRSVRDFKPGQRVKRVNHIPSELSMVVEKVGRKYVYTRLPRTRRSSAIGYLPGQLVHV